MKKFLPFLLFAFFTLSCTTETLVNGEIFVVTKGADNYKLGAVSVGAYLKKDVELQMATFKDSLFSAVEDAENERMSCTSKVSSITNPYGWERELNECFDKEQAALVSEFYKIFSIAFPAKATATTNSDGKFTLKLPSKGEYVIVARAKRMVGSSEENYFFYRPVISDGLEKTEIISNNDVLESEKVKVLFK